MKGRGSFQVEALLPLEVEGKKLCLENWPDEMHWMGVMFFHLEEVTCYCELVEGGCLPIWRELSQNLI